MVPSQYADLLKTISIELTNDRHSQNRKFLSGVSMFILGLGNPGNIYAKTRHNLGFMALDALAKCHGLTFLDNRPSVRLATGVIKGHEVILVKPRTFVNQTGKAINYLHDRYKLTSDQLLVIVDDMALPLGRLRIRKKGSSGGHNGLQSIIDSLGSVVFTRIRVGIGSPGPLSRSLDYVLEPFTNEELPILPGILDQIVGAVQGILANGPDCTMSDLNRRNKSLPSPDELTNDSSQLGRPEAT